MGRKAAVLAAIWIGFVLYTLWLAPVDHPYTWWFGKKLLTLQWGEPNAILMAIFGLMGVWPMIYGCMMFADGRTQPFRVWPYFVGANFTGVICLLPYLIMRRSNQDPVGPKDQFLEIFDRRSTGIGLLVSTVVLLAYAAIAGDWSEYAQQFWTKPFVHMITLDFCCMALIFPISTLFEDDMSRRGIKNTEFFKWLAWVPLFGPLIYLCLRPPLPETQRSQPRKAHALSTSPEFTRSQSG